MTIAQLRHQAQATDPAPGLSLPMVARSLVEGAGHHIEHVFLDDAVEKFIRCPTP
jgi:hypothetical protein